MINRFERIDSVTFASTLAWLLIIPLCPGPLAVLLPNGCAAGFMCLLMLGCALRCLTEPFLAPSMRTPSPLALGLPCGVALILCAQVMGLPHPMAWVCAGGLAAGAGLGQGMLRWARRSSGLPLHQVAQDCAAAGVGAVLFGALLQVCIGVKPALWVLLAGCSVLAALGGFSPSRGSRGSCESCETDEAACSGPAAPIVLETRGCAFSTAIHEQAAGLSQDARMSLRQACSLLSKLWEPALGLGLSFLSALLPWGALMTAESASMPVFWSFAAGIAALCLALHLFATRIHGKLDPDIALHIVVPVLAASVVGLRMLGDLDRIGAGLTALKGVGSGITSAGFLCFALIAMVHLGNGRPRSVDPLALGLGVACLLGSLTLPLHMAHQQFASLVAPFLSLSFLVASCCSSVVHIRKHVGSQEPRRLSIEEAAERLAEEHGLSPRERQVMRHLVLGRSAEAIGVKLGISPNTVRSHVVNIHTKLAISSRDDLADLIEALMDSSESKIPGK